MRWTRSFAIVAFLVGTCCYGQMSLNAATKTSTLVDPGYSITVAPPADPIRSGPHINVTVTVKNITNREIPWRSEFSDTAYQAFRIRLAKNGREVETTAFHRRMRGKQRPDDPPEVEIGSSIISPVAPGKSFSFTIDLKRLYQIMEPGVYTLDVSRIEDDNVTIVHAKTLTVNIVQ